MENVLNSSGQFLHLDDAVEIRSDLGMSLAHRISSLDWFLSLQSSIPLKKSQPFHNHVVNISKIPSHSLLAALGYRLWGKCNKVDSESTRVVIEIVNQKNVLDRNSLCNEMFLDVIVLVLKSVILITIIFLAIINNILVIISVVLYRKLRHVNNYFLVSLAFADLFVAIFAMTFNATLEISGIMLSSEALWLQLVYFAKTFCDLACNSTKRFSDIKKQKNTSLNKISC